MRLNFYLAMGALAGCMLFAPGLEGLFMWCVLLAIAGAIWLLTPGPGQE